MSSFPFFVDSEKMDLCLWNSFTEKTAKALNCTNVKLQIFMWVSDFIPFYGRYFLNIFENHYFNHILSTSMFFYFGIVKVLQKAIDNRLPICCHFNVCVLLNIDYRSVQGKLLLKLLSTFSQIYFRRRRNPADIRSKEM